MRKPIPTGEQKRAKAVNYARWAIIAWPIGFLLYVGLLCWYFLERYETASTLDGYDALRMSAGLMVAAYGYADAKCTLRTNGKELGSPGYVVAILLFNGVPFIRDVRTHGLPAHFWPLMFGVWLLIVPIVIWKVRQLRRIRRESNRRV